MSLKDGLGQRHSNLTKRDMGLAVEVIQRAYDEIRVFELAVEGGHPEEAVRSVFFITEMLDRAKKSIEMASKSMVAGYHETAQAFQSAILRRQLVTPDDEEDEEEGSEDDESQVH